MSYPSPGATYRNCIVCGRPFRTQKNQLLVRPNVFCTTTCYWKSWRAFRRALASGLLEQILEIPVVKEWLSEDTRPARNMGIAATIEGCGAIESGFSARCVMLTDQNADGSRIPPKLLLRSVCDSIYA